MSDVRAVRMDDMGVDDVAIDATMFRFERMDEQTFWLCAYRGDKRTTFTMWAQDGKLYCRKDEDELDTHDDSDNPVIPEPFPPASPTATLTRETMDLLIAGLSDIHELSGTDMLQSRANLLIGIVRAATTRTK